MQKLKTVLFSDLFFFFLITFTMLSLSVYPTLYFVFHSPPDRIFPLLHNSAGDYYYYLTMMNQGRNGAFLAHDSYTTEPSSGSLIEVFFVYLGKLGSFLHLSLPLTYFLGRVLFGALFFLLAYYLISLFFPKGYRKIAFLFTALAGPLLRTNIVNNQTITTTYLDWWTGIDPVHRAAFLPHHMLGNALFLLSVILLIKFIRSQKNHYLIIGVFTSSLAGLIHTPNIIVLLITLSTAILLHLLLNFREWRKNLHLYQKLIFFCLTLFPVPIILYLQTKLGFPWSIIIKWEEGQIYPLREELLGGIGPILFLAAIGFIFLYRRLSLERALVATWAFVPLIFVYFSQIFHLNAVRFLQGAPFVPLAILATYSLQFMETDQLQQFINKKSLANLSKNPLMLFILILFLFFSLPPLKQELNSQIQEYTPIYSNIYLAKTFFQAFAFINRSLPPKSHVLATFYTSNYLPAFTDTISFLGHRTYTYNLSQKEALATSFYQGKLTDKEVSRLMQDNHLDLIWQGWDEKALNGNQRLYPNVLKSIFENQDVTLYTLLLTAKIFKPEPDHSQKRLDDHEGI